MKKFLSVFLVLCTVLSLVALPAVNVGAEAADTILYKMRGTDSVVTAAEYSFADGAVNKGSFEKTSTTTATGITVTETTENGAKVLNAKKEATASGAVDDTYTLTADSSVSTNNLSKIIYYFKVKGNAVKLSDAGAVDYESNGNKQNAARLMFDSYATIGGTEKTVRGFWLTNGGVSGHRGTGSGADGWKGDTFTYTTDADGYFSVRAEIYKSSSDNAIYQKVYDAYTDTELMYHKYNTTTLSDDVLTGKFTFNMKVEGSMKDIDFTMSLKDLKVEYYIDAEKEIGSVEAESYVAPQYNYDTGEISATPAPGATNADRYLIFTPSSEITQGTIVVDFELKTESMINTDNVESPSSNRYFGISTATSYNSAAAYKSASKLTYDGSGLSFGRVNGSTFYITNEGHNYTSAALSDKLGQYVPIRVVISRTDTTKGWSVAYYNLNTSSTVPVALGYTGNASSTDTSAFKGFCISWYQPAGDRGASTADSTKAKIQLPVTVKNLVMKQINTTTNTAAYGNFANGTSSGSNKLPIQKDPTAKTVTFNDTIYVRSKSGQTPKAYLVVTQSDGTQVCDEKTLTDGINYPVTLTCSNIENVSAATAKFYIFDGESWYNNEEYLAPGEAKLTTQSVKSQTSGGGAVMRFIFKAEYNGTPGKFGAYIIPYDLFSNTSDTNIINVKNETGAIQNGDTFSADLTAIPSGQYDRGIIAIPYLYVNGTEKLGTDITTSYTVNDTKVN